MTHSDAPAGARRLVWAGAVIAILFLVMVALGLGYSLTARSKLCPPGNPDCGPLPPSGATAPSSAIPHLR